MEGISLPTNTPISGRLLKGLAILLYCHHAGPLLTMHVPGGANTMADIASRPTKAKQLFRRCTESDSDFPSVFSNAFPLPDKQVWQLATIPDWIITNIFETLRGKRLAMQQWMLEEMNLPCLPGRLPPWEPRNFTWRELGSTPGVEPGTFQRAPKASTEKT